MSHHSLISSYKLACPPPTPQNRKSHTLVSYKDKALILFGGYSGSHQTNDLWIHTPFTSNLQLDLSNNSNNAMSTSWKRIDIQQSNVATPSKRHCHACSIYKNHMILFGGDSGGNEILNDLWQLDLRSGKYHWTKIEYNPVQISSHNIPKPRYGHTATVIQDTLWIFGGFTRKSSKTGGMYFNDLWAYHFPSGTWRKIVTPKEEKPSKRCYHSAVVFNDIYILVFGGLSMGHNLNDTWIFDTRTEKWKEIYIPNENKPSKSPPKKTSINDNKNQDDIPIPRAKHAATIFDGRIMFISGGFSGLFRENDFWCLQIAEQNNNSGFVGKWHRIDEPQSVNSLPIARDSHSIAFVGSNLFLFGGSGTGKILNDYWILDMTKVINNLPKIKYGSNTSSHYVQSSQFQEEKQQRKSTTQDSFQSNDSYTTNTDSTNSSPNISRKDENDTNFDEDQNLEEEFFGSLSEALQNEEKRLLNQVNEYKKSPKQNFPRDQIIDNQTKFKSNQSFNKLKTSPLSQKSSNQNRDDSSSQKISSIEKQLQQLIERQNNEEKRNEEFRNQILKELNQAKSIMKKQGEALEALENVVHKEIQTRIAGEDKTQAYFNFMSSQQANALALQTHQYQLSVERISSIIQHLMGNKSNQNTNISISHINNSSDNIVNES